MDSFGLEVVGCRCCTGLSSLGVLVPGSYTTTMEYTTAFAAAANIHPLQSAQISFSVTHSGLASSINSDFSDSHYKLQSSVIEACSTRIGSRHMFTCLLFSSSSKLRTTRGENYRH